MTEYNYIFYNNNCIKKMPSELFNFLHKIIKIKGNILEIRQRAGIGLPPIGFIEIWDSIERKSSYGIDNNNLVLIK